MRLSTEEKEALQRLIDGKAPVDDILGQLQGILAQAEGEEARVAKSRWRRMRLQFPVQTRMTIERSLTEKVYQPGSMTDVRALLREELRILTALQAENR